MQAEEMARLLADLDTDALLVTTPENVRYLSGFTTPKDGRVLLTRERACLITDGRYQMQAAAESRLPVEVRRDWLPWVAEQVGDGRLGIEADSLTVNLFRDLARELGREPLLTQGVFDSKRMTKSNEELANLRRAAAIADESFGRIIELIRPGVRELDIALELERSMLSLGAEAKSFDTVVASGLRSAMPHGVASTKEIESGDLVTLDFGATVGGYHSDMTRTVAVGPVRDELEALYEAVHEALLESLAAIAPGRSGAEVDAVARKALARRDLDGYFVHSLGHGVGLAIHEGPRLSRDSRDVLAPGMVVTVEPGAYLPDVGGVRIEDLVLITDSGYERLSKSPREFITLG